MEVLGCLWNRKAIMSSLADLLEGGNAVGVCYLCLSDERQLAVLSYWTDCSPETTVCPVCLHLTKNTNIILTLSFSWHSNSLSRRKYPSSQLPPTPTFRRLRLYGQMMPECARACSLVAPRVIMIIKMNIAAKPGNNHCLTLETVDWESRDSDRQMDNRMDCSYSSQSKTNTVWASGRTDRGRDGWIPLVLKKLFSSSVLSSWYSVVMVPVFSPRYLLDCLNIQNRVIDHSSAALWTGKQRVCVCARTCDKISFLLKKNIYVSDCMKHLHNLLYYVRKHLFFSFCSILWIWGYV